MNVLRNLTLSVAFYSKIANFSFFQKNSKFFRKPIFFYKEAQIFWTFWENCQFQIKLKSIFFCKNLVSVLYQPTIWTFWEILLLQLLSTANLIPLAIFEIFNVFFRKNHFFLQKTQFLKFLRNLTVPFEFDIKLANCFSRIRHQFG